MLHHSGVMLKRRKISPHMKWQLAAQQKFKCALCGELLGDAYSFDVDHILPLVDGGADELHNMQIICTEEHRLKSRCEMAARSRPEGEFYCEVCNMYFTKYFLHHHIHKATAETLRHRLLESQPARAHLLGNRLQEKPPGCQSMTSRLRAALR